MKKAPEVIAVGGPNPWVFRSVPTGQPVTEWSSDAFTLSPEHFTENRRDFAHPKVLRWAVELTAHDTGMSVLPGRATAIEIDAKRLKVKIETASDSKLTVVLAEGVDVAVGPGPARKLSCESVCKLYEEKLLIDGSKHLAAHEDYSDGATVVVYGGGAAAAWNAYWPRSEGPPR